MSFWQQHKSPLGYVSNGNKIDTYGVDHSGFTTRDELQYQNARINRENNLMKQMQNQGITDYPQYTTNFWGTNADNNYGFGSSNIGSNIENMKQNITTSISQVPALSQSQNNILPNIYEAQQQNPLQQIIGAISDMTKEYFKMKNHGYKYLDDYHHCKANYNAASRGLFGYNTAKYLGDKKETFDFYWNQLYKGRNKAEAIADRNHDSGVNAIGRLRGDPGLYDSVQDACADYRLKNPSFPKKYW